MYFLSNQQKSINFDVKLMYNASELGYLGVFLLFNSSFTSILIQNEFNLVYLLS